MEVREKEREGEGVVLHKIASGIRMAKFVGAMCTVSLIGKQIFGRLLLERPSLGAALSFLRLIVAGQATGLSVRYTTGNNSVSIDEKGGLSSEFPPPARHSPPPSASF